MWVSSGVLHNVLWSMVTTVDHGDNEVSKLL
jgi:hypothetical protein